MQRGRNEPVEAVDDRPPFGKRWRVLYGAVIVILAVYVGVFALLTRVYA